MDPVSFLPAIAIMLLVVAISSILARRFGMSLEQGRYDSIDGLRGYLALFVFLHHSCIWYFSLRTGRLQLPPSNLYIHFGQSSVALFFMITSFLFFSKLIDGRKKSIDWARLYISRFLRLVPLYFFAMSLIFVLVVYFSKGKINEPISQLLTEVMQWLAFTIIGAPTINGVNPLGIGAGVTWTLPYEWLFYFSLPLVALAVGVVAPLKYIALSIVSIAGLTLFRAHISLPLMMPFLGGIVASILTRSDWFRQVAAKRSSAFFVLGFIAIVVAFYPSAYGPVPFFLLSAAFALIAAGNTLFGVLVTPASRTLGEMSYSIYLLHGIVLFVTFYFILGVDSSRVLSPEMHWLLMAGVASALIFISFFTFRFIEKPAMRKATTLTTWLRLYLPSKSAKSWALLASEKRF